MKLTAALLVLCVFAAVAESQAVIARRAPWQTSERNLLTLAISGIQDAVGAAMSAMLDAATALTQEAMGAAEGVTGAAIELAVKLVEKLVSHNTFAVRILQCLEGATKQAVVGTVVQVQCAIVEALNLRGKQQAEAAQERGLPGEAAGAVIDCVMRALQASVWQLQEQALRLVGNGGRSGTAAVGALAKAIEEHVKGDPAVLRSVGVAEQVARSLSHEAEQVIDGRAHSADDSRRNILKDVVDRMNAAMAENLAQWTDNTTSAAEIKAEDLIVQAEKAADEALRKAQQVVEDNLVDGSDWEKALVALLKKPESAKQQVASNGDVEVRSAADVAHHVAVPISSS